MDLVIGRGRVRSVYTLPCADILKRAPESEVVLLHTNLCKLIGVDPEMAVLAEAA